MLITPEGEWMTVGSDEFLAALGDPEPDYDSVAFAIKNLGFIKFETLGNSLIEIEFHPRNVGLPGLLAAQQLLLSSPTTLYRIKYLSDEWHSEISSSAEHTVERLSELCVPTFTLPTIDRFNVEPKDLSELFNEEDNWLRVLAQKWRASFGHFDPSVISFAAKHNMLSRIMIAGMKPRGGDPVWRFIGDDHKWIGTQYQLSGLGEKVGNMPDKDYGAWAAEYYRSVAELGRPRFDLIKGSIQYVEEQGKPWKLVRYERLMLPWKTPSGEVFVTMCSRILGRDVVSNSSSTAPGRPVADALAISA
jgi:hypothetical protein